MALGARSCIVSDKKTILVIDDEADVVTYLTTVLEDNDFATLSAKDGVEGLEQAKSGKPDLILLDISMPEKSGVRLYRDLREDPELAEIPVVMVTGVMPEFEKFISSRRQVPPPDGYISKPVEPQVVVDKVKELLGL